MKESKTNSFSVVTTKYKIPDKSKIMDLIHDKITNFIKLTGHDPIGIVIGPKEYTALIEIFRNEPDSFSNYQCSFGYTEKVFGLPLHLKMSPGIDVLLNKNDVFRFAYGIIE